MLSGLFLMLGYYWSWLTRTNSPVPANFGCFIAKSSWLASALGGIV